MNTLPLARLAQSRPCPKLNGVRSYVVDKRRSAPHAVADDRNTGQPHKLRLVLCLESKRFSFGRVKCGAISILRFALQMIDAVKMSGRNR